MRLRYVLVLGMAHQDDPAGESPGATVDALLESVAADWLGELTLEGSGRPGYAQPARGIPQP